ncbi:hypothetical protein F5Y10DRAFT_290979 [Nemania abortiva]|nr:hypothetical protein F5Y10DRAFT_290979 [Nemania abortiva]
MGLCQTYLLPGTFPKTLGTKLQSAGLVWLVIDPKDRIIPSCWKQFADRHQLPYRTSIDTDTTPKDVYDISSSDEKPIPHRTSTTASEQQGLTTTSSTSKLLTTTSTTTTKSMPQPQPPTTNPTSTTGTTTTVDPPPTGNPTSNTTESSTAPS